ncbi:hypothetical protein MLGJGCBP_05028 [Rhodococcus sp. T7]|nr:hypothetical protein MLGJGCBP_09406 [Rhodococcus sp. T7]KAF0961803.1 hypothetical protein MLGJGCBP_05028 [Rhodococcus sp. T7]
MIARLRRHAWHPQDQPEGASAICVSGVTEPGGSRAWTSSGAACCRTSVSRNATLRAPPPRRRSAGGRVRSPTVPVRTHRSPSVRAGVGPRRRKSAPMPLPPRLPPEVPHCNRADAPTRYCRPLHRLGHVHWAGDRRPDRHLSDRDLPTRRAANRLESPRFANNVTAPEKCIFARNSPTRLHISSSVPARLRQHGTVPAAERQTNRDGDSVSTSRNAP